MSTIPKNINPTPVIRGHVNWRSIQNMEITKVITRIGNDRATG